MLKTYLNKGFRLNILKDFCDFVFAQETQLLETKHIRLKVKIFPVSTSGFIRIWKKKEDYRFYIIINLLPFILNKHLSDTMRYFYLYATIVHELRHIELLSNTAKKNYRELLAFWDEARCFSHLHWLNEINFLFAHEERKKLRKRQYAVSASEILCNLNGYQRSYDLFREYLSDREHIRIETAIDSLRFLNKHMAISYTRTNRPSNQFVRMVQEAQFIFRKKMRIRKMFAPLDNLLSSTGRIKSIDQIFSSRSDDNEDLIDKILVNMFICADLNLQRVFDGNQEIKTHLTRLANEYCDATVYYLQNIKIGEVFLDSSILQDNAAMLIKNTQRLNLLMQRYNMERTNGSVIPLYNTGK